MVHNVTTEHGTYAVDDEVLKDMHFLDCMADLQQGDALAVSMLVRLMFGDRNILYNVIADENGRVPMDVCMREINEIIRIVGEQNAQAKK